MKDTITQLNDKGKSTDVTATVAGALAVAGTAKVASAVKS